MMAAIGTGCVAPGRLTVSLGTSGTLFAYSDTPVVDPDGRCQPTRMSRSGSTVRYEIDCTMEGRRMVGKGESTASGNTIHSRMDAAMMDGSGRHTMQTESQMTYLGPDCRGLAPVGGAKR